ncbi:hypothetical protein KAFR_0A05140 [Kazachstania africana CBS 2517]|uniref:Uncharacterized protein n=1 Tax=Kazachstania africana (strain ATCC 22294 / BCRC 22015 / CBS 2517 / CECT 1963 / NBRC 1671 / NRRL Y-8276) TaxID=1071382 RepID=H2ANJ9_KAZAF|nr:hypothetical protein KAFR_0A05140 [Kazachstania africana CBS 2517]CCF55949.1 hypothetical protein KAFR_0A05140 [Kazachstania africana CBS 2517]
MHGDYKQDIAEILRNKSRLGNWAVCGSYFQTFIIEEGRGRNNEEVKILLCFMPSSFMYFEKVSPLICYITYESVKKQCLAQGFENTDLIFDEMCRQIKGRNTVDYKVRKNLEFKIDLSNVISVTFKFPLIKADTASHILAKSFTREILESNKILWHLKDDFINLVREKDRVIEFMKGTIKELGGETIVKKWAPVGSFNYSAITEFDVQSQTRKSFEETASSNRDDLEVTRNMLQLLQDYREVQLRVAKTKNVEITGLERLSTSELSSFEEDEGTYSSTEESAASTPTSSPFDEVSDSNGKRSLPPTEEMSLTEHTVDAIDVGSSINTNATASNLESPSKKRKFGKIKIDQ